MTLVLALALLILEALMPRHKPHRPVRVDDPATQTLLQTLHPHAAGVDVGAREMWVAAAPGSAPPAPPDQPPELPAHVRGFGTFTADLRAIVAWLRACGTTTIAMEATGIYWIPLYDLLETEGFEVLLVDPQQITRAPGRPKTDVEDCQWIQRLHSVGLLCAAFRPEESIRVWRSYQRQRATLVADAGRHIQRMQKALEQMNVKLTEVVSDITGQTGLAILKAILQGERDPVKLASLRDRRCKESEATIALALTGTWQAEHLFVLRQELELYEYYHRQIAACDAAIDQHLGTQAVTNQPAPAPKKPVRKRKANEPHFAARQRLYQMANVDLTAIEGIEINTALVILSEIGLDMTRWPSAKQFGSWLGLAPCPKKSGGKVLSSRTRPGVNRAAHALRMAARCLQRSKSALGAFFRRIAARRGVPKAITATAYKLARLVYALLKHGQAYVAVGMDEYEAKYKERAVRNLKRKAMELGMVVMAPGTPEPAH
jgi:transposase